jgi:hypothetical protein
MPATSRTSPPSPLDRWLPEFHARTLHTQRVPVAPDRLWHAAQTVRVRDTRTLRPIIALRFGPYAPSADTTFRELFRRPPFTVLEESTHSSVSGLAGRLWALGDTFAMLESPDEYAAFAKPGTAKVAVLNQVRPRGRGGSELVSETRVWCTDRSARVRFASLWAVVGPFSRFIPLDLLSAAARQARSAPPPRGRASGR